jgi:hypothetical protein
MNRDKLIGLLSGLVAVAVSVALMPVIGPWGFARTRRRRAREHGDLASTT